MPYQYGQGFEKDLNSLVKLIKKDFTIDFDPTFLEDEVKKILKYNKDCTHEKWVWTSIVMNKHDPKEETIDAKLCLKCKVITPFCREWNEFFTEEEQN